MDLDGRTPADAAIVMDLIGLNTVGSFFMLGAASLSGNTAWKEKALDNVYDAIDPEAFAQSTTLAMSMPPVEGTFAGFGAFFFRGAVKKVVEKEVVQVVANTTVKESNVTNQFVSKNGDTILDKAKLLGHIVKDHAWNASREIPAASKFNKGEDILKLVMKSSGADTVKQTVGRNYQRIIDAGKNIGKDRATGNQTSVYTVILDKMNKVITSFPGTPK